MYRPPSLQTLRTLEAAARHRSFSKAAEELGVTHGAVSHRVREVEARLGAVMFERRGNAMEPTRAALQLLPTIRQTLELIASIFPPPPPAARRLLSVGVLQSFAAHWLIPRLASFHAANPGVFIALDPGLDPSPIGPGGVDAAIRYGSGAWPALKVTRLLADSVYPACSPQYRDRLGIEDVADLARCHLLRNSWQPWTPWFQRAGLQLPEPTDSHPYEDAGLMLDAAVAGHGVALVRRVLAHDAIASGRLVRLSPVEHPFDGAYHFVRAQPYDSAIEAFGTWLAEQLHRDFG